MRYAVLGQEESCTGDPARRMGNDYVFQMLAMANVETLNRYKPKTIVTACPHCFNTIGNEYGQLGGHYNVVHHSQFLSTTGGGGQAAPRLPGGHRRRWLAGTDPARLVLPDALQRCRRGDSRRAAGRARRRAARDGEVRQVDVLLRRRRRSDVDGGAARHAHQRRADAAGPGHRRGDGRHGVSVLPGHDARRRGRRRRRGARASSCRTSPRLLAAALPASTLAGRPANGRSLPILQ